MTAVRDEGGWPARARTVVLAALLALCAGCATTGNGDPRDPVEGFNRAMFAFNDGFDEAIGKPVASAYKNVLPDPLRGFVRNFFGNLADLWIGANNMLQGKLLEGWTDWVRFAFNSTFGFLGINDIATEFGLEKHDEDFGQTFGRWGVGDGAYLVWPFLGSSTARDTAGLVFDIGLDPVRRHDPKDARYFSVGLRAIGRRADLLDASRILEEAALDKYVFQRDAYLQRRRSLINDGRSQRAERGSPHAEGEPTAPAVRMPERPAGAPSAPLGQVFEPRVPRNYEAVLSASRGD